MEKKRKEIVGEEEEKYDLAKDEDIDKMIEQLERERKEKPPTAVVQPPPAPAPAA